MKEANRLLMNVVTSSDLSSNVKRDTLTGQGWWGVGAWEDVRGEPQCPRIEYMYSTSLIFNKLLTSQAFEISHFRMTLRTQLNVKDVSVTNRNISCEYLCAKGELQIMIGYCQTITCESVKQEQDGQGVAIQKTFLCPAHHIQYKLLLWWTCSQRLTGRARLPHYLLGRIKGRRARGRQRRTSW